MARRDQNLFRDDDDKMIGGVCSGLGHYFDIDTTLVRVAFVTLMLFGGGGFLGYVILWIVMDPAPDNYWSSLGVETDGPKAPVVEESPASQDSQAGEESEHADVGVDVIDVVVDADADGLGAGRT